MAGTTPVQQPPENGHIHGGAMIVPLLNATGGRRRTSRRVALLVGVGLLSTGVATLPAKAGAPVEAGYADFTYGTVTDDVTAHTSQSKLWFNDGIWWAVMMEPAATAPVAHENRWAIYRFDVPSQTWLSTKVQVDERNQSHPDVLSVGNSVFVVSSYSRSATEAVKVYKFDYNGTSKSYALDPLFQNADKNPNLARPDDGIETQARGIQYATIAQVDSDSLAIAYTSSNEVWYMTSDMRAVEWTAPVPLGTGTRAPIADPPGPETASSDDIAVAVGDGPGTAGVMWSRTSTLASPYGGFYFAPWTGSGFGPIEDAWHGDAVGDNHVSAKLAGDRLLVAVKTSLKGSDDPLISLLERTTSGVWQPARTVISRRAGGVKQDATRPVLVLDDSQAHVLMTDTVGGGAIYRNSAPLGTLAFTNGMGSAFIKDPAHPNIDDTTTTKQLMPAGTGIVAQASDDVDGRDRYFHGCTAGSCPAGGVVQPPPAPTKPTTTTLTSTPNPSVAGGPVTLRATVSGGSGIGGSVSFLEGETVLKTVAVSNGVASTVTSFPAGRYSLKAVYNGDSTTYLPSASGVIVQRVEAASTSTAGSGGVGRVTAVAPPGTRLSVISPPRRVATAKKLGAGKSTVVALPAPSNLSAAAVNVTVQAGKKATAVAVCKASQSAASCRSAPLLELGKRTRAARFAVVPLDGPRLRLYNAAGKARITVDAQGWFVPDASKLKLSALAAPARVVKGAKVSSAKPYALRIPANLRPAGTKAVQLNIAAKKPSANSVLSACKAKATRASCLSRPTLFTKRGSTATNRVIVPVSKNGTVRLVNGSGSVKVSVWVSGVFTAG